MKSNQELPPLTGLAIASRLPLKKVEFFPFSEHGTSLHAFVDAEVFARKGVGRARVRKERVTFL